MSIFSGSLLLGQTPAIKDRITAPIDASRRIVLSALAHPDARPEFDRGAVDPSTSMGYMQIIFKASLDQQAQLQTLLDAQQNPLSPQYHKWLTPEQYAARFGVSANDIRQISEWLASQGFSIIQVARAGNWIAFTGTAGQANRAFATEIRHYEVNGEMHYLNATAPSVPAAIAPLVSTILGLNDIRVQPGPRSSRPIDGPKSVLNGNLVVTPLDLATIYDVSPLWSQGITGKGQKIVIIGASDIYIDDIRSFRSALGLPANDPEQMLIPGGTDPGVNEAMTEADLDLEESGGIAPLTQQYYIYASNFINALNYAVDANIAPVISMSFGFCEADASELGIGANFMEPVAQQAASQGISILVSSGDAGAAFCDQHAMSASHGLAVNLFASAPDATGVGGTMFNQTGGTYWSASGAPLGYIPEAAWNETSETGELSASAGGLSIIYPKPAWQTGSAFPSANQRAVPDLALDSALDDDGYAIFSNGGWTVVGGTSAATPLFGGMVTLLNQYTASTGLGSLNANLYRLAQTSAGAFHDVTAGNNEVPCVALSPNCGSNGYEGYAAGPGYDVVTGWGSVDLAKMAAGWSAGQLRPSITVSANPQTVALNGTVTLTATVSSPGSSTSPTGTVTFLLGSASVGANPLTSSGLGVSTASVTVYASSLPAGNDVIIASYSGDRTFTSVSTTITITVGAATPGTSAVVPTISPNPVYQRTSGSTTGWFFTATLTEVNGVGTTFNGFTVGGTSYASDISTWFGTSQISAYGTVSAQLYFTQLTVPATITFQFSGVDASGRTWNQAVAVQFLGPQLSGFIRLTGLPNVVEQDLQISGEYQWCQNLGLDEENGHTIYLTKFLADGQDLSSQIEDYFGDIEIPPFGSLLGGICWSIGGSLPQTLSYEVDGIDDLGNNISTTMSATFQGPATSPGKLIPSTEFVTMSVPNSGQSTTTTMSVNVNSGQPWSVSIFPSNPSTTWLTVYPLSGTGPGSITISASSAATASSGALAPGLYLATLVFQSTNAIPQYYNTYLYFVVGSPQITHFYNSAWYTDQPNSPPADTGISPGLIFTLTGNGLGPQIWQTWYLNDNGDVASDLYGVKVLVNGYAAPILYAGQGQINAIAPYEIANSVGTLATIQVSNNGVLGNAYSERVVATSPGMFSLGNNQAAILNADYSINGPNNPAARGSVVALYASGEGQLNPAGVDGALANEPFASLPRPVGAVSVSFGGVQATNITYAGTVPTSFEGFFQVNVQIPNNAPTGTIPVVLTVGGNSSLPQNIVVQ